MMSTFSVKIINWLMINCFSETKLIGCRLHHNLPYENHIVFNVLKRWYMTPVKKTLPLITPSFASIYSSTYMQAEVIFEQKRLFLGSAKLVHILPFWDIFAPLSEWINLNTSFLVLRNKGGQRHGSTTLSLFFN